MGSKWWVAEFLHTDPALLTAWVFWVIFSICLHELAHGWAAIRVGDRTPIETGHMTWNPLVHMGWFSLIVFAVVGIAWGAMPVSPYRMRGPHAEAKVALAGPGMNVTLAMGCMFIAGVVTALPVEGRVPDVVILFFHAGAMLNVVLALFNMLPIPPLDGSRVLALYARGYRDLIYGPNGQIVMIAGMLLVFWFGADVLFEIGADITRGGVDWVAGLFGGAAEPAPACDPLQNR